LAFSSQFTGFLFGLTAYSMWGFFPLFFHLLRDVPSTEVLLHRVIWSFIFVFLLILVVRGQSRLWRTLQTPSLLRGLLLSSFLVSLNWLVFIWAVAQGRVLESSLGYFLTPLISVFLARVFLGETMNRAQLLAIMIAILGILWLLLRLGYLPWVSLVLAISFGLYGLVRKQLDVDTFTGLAVETGWLLPLAAAYWCYLASQQQDHFFQAIDSYAGLLVSSGLVTSMPLLFFAAAARRLSLTVVGFMMYVNPSLQFLVALFILGEAFNRDQFIGFCFIWSALVVFTLGSIRNKPAISG
jgi:chloramphenicol-sensitive protein RarD